MVDDFCSRGAEEQPRGSSAKAQKRGRFPMEGSGSLNLAYYGGASCLQLLSLNGSAFGSWPLRTAGEEYRHGEPGEDVLLNIETWHENLGRCLGSCQGTRTFRLSGKSRESNTTPESRHGDEEGSVAV